MSESVARHGVVVIGRVIHVVSVSERVWVAVDCVVGVIGEEQTVPSAVLLVVSVGLVAVGLIVGLEHGPLGDIELLLGDHGGEGLKVGSGVPGIPQLVFVNCIACEEVPTGKTQPEEVEAENLSCMVAWVQIHEIVPVLHERHSGKSSLCALHAACCPNGKWGCQNAADSSIRPESEGVLELDLTLVLPGPSLGACHQFSGMICDPGVRKELVIQPIINQINKLVMEERGFSSIWTQSLQ